MYPVLVLLLNQMQVLLQVISRCGKVIAGSGTVNCKLLQLMRTFLMKILVSH